MDNYKKEILFKEIDLIQNCIDKASQNSFLVKGWVITLIAVLWALFAENISYWLIAIIALASTISFWYIDAFFLRVDRLYRWKYDWVIQNRKTNDEFQFDLNPYNEQMLGIDKNNKPRHVPRLRAVFFSSNLIAFYLPLIIVSFLALLFAHQ